MKKNSGDKASKPSKKVKTAKVTKTESHDCNIPKAIYKLGIYHHENPSLTGDTVSNIGHFEWTDGWLTDERCAKLTALVKLIADWIDSRGGVSSGQLVHQGAIVVITGPEDEVTGLMDWYRNWAETNGCKFDWMDWH